MDKKDLDLIFIYFEKTYDGLSREIMGQALENKRVRIDYIRVVKNMYNGASTNERTHDAAPNDFLITIGLHQ